MGWAGRGGKEGADGEGNWGARQMEGRGAADGGGKEGGAADGESIHGP